MIKLFEFDPWFPNRNTPRVPPSRNFPQVDSEHRNPENGYECSPVKGQNWKQQRKAKMRSAGLRAQPPLCSQSQTDPPNCATSIQRATYGEVCAHDDS